MTTRPRGSRAALCLRIDGLPVYIPYDGYVDLSRFTTHDAAEISVSKGASSTLLGPNALGGAINLISRQPAEQLEFDARTGWFTGEGLEAAFNLGSQHEHGYVQVGGSPVEQGLFRVSSAGRYRIWSGGHQWLDVVAGERLIPSADFQGRPGCAALHKVVEFELPAARDLILQLSGDAGAVVTVLITPAPRPPAPGE